MHLTRQRRAPRSQEIRKSYKTTSVSTGNGARVRGNSNDLHPKYLTTPTASAPVLLLLLLLREKKCWPLRVAQFATRNLAIFESRSRSHRAENSPRLTFASKRGWKR